MGSLTHPSPSALPAQALPAVRAVPWSRPFTWLGRGARDLQRLGGRSLAYGAVVAVAGAVLLALVWRATYLVPAFIGGFLLVAPAVAVGLYALSRQLEAGEVPHMRAALRAWRANADSIALFGLMLVLALFAWERLAAIIFALFFGERMPELAALFSGWRGAADFGPMVIAFVGTGAALAALVFMFSVVSAPLLLDRPLDAVSAALTSLRCCWRNPGAMLTWAALLAAITALGFATAMIGMVWFFPWLAHASWHAYRDLVELPEA
jgi:uncharacterized membrane protein